MTLRDLHPSADLTSYYGANLRRRRIEAGISQDELGRRIHYTTAMVSMVEVADRVPGEPFSLAVDAELGADGMLHDLWKLARRADIAEWFRDYADLEARATSICAFESQVVTGLLQTEEYARVIIMADQPQYTREECERDVAVRLNRQQILERPTPPLLWLILDEAPLHRPVGGPAVMRDQLRKLLHMAGRPRVVIQVLPFRAGVHAGMDGPFMFLELPKENDVTYAEVCGKGRVISEPGEVATRRHAFDRLRASALSESDSFRMIAAILEGYDDATDA